MHTIILFTKTIHRNSTHCNRELHGRINAIEKKRIGSYCSDSVPRVGDVIRYNGDYYDVLCVIRDVTFDYRGIPNDDFIILEVKVHSNRHLYTTGSDAFEEEIPLVTQIDEKKH